MKLKFMITSLLTLWCIAPLYSQENNKNSLEHLSASYSLNSLEFSLGESIIGTSFSSNDLFLSQGFIQTFNTKNEFIQTKYTIFPNPSSDFLSLVPSIEGDHLVCQIFDHFGKIILTENISFDNNQLEINHLFSGVYYLRIINEKEEAQIIKFIKI